MKSYRIWCRLDKHWISLALEQHMFKAFVFFNFTKKQYIVYRVMGRNCRLQSVVCFARTLYFLAPYFTRAFTCQCTVLWTGHTNLVFNLAQPKDIHTENIAVCMLHQKDGNCKFDRANTVLSYLSNKLVLQFQLGVSFNSGPHNTWEQPG